MLALQDFPEIKDGERVFQKNEGKWNFSLQESDDGCALPCSLQLELNLLKHWATSRRTLAATWRLLAGLR
jgi:hypothetical protein